MRQGTQEYGSTGNDDVDVCVHGPADSKDDEDVSTVVAVAVVTMVQKKVNMFPSSAWQMQSRELVIHPLRLHAH